MLPPTPLTLLAHERPSTRPVLDGPVVLEPSRTARAVHALVAHLRSSGRPRPHETPCTCTEPAGATRWS